MTGDIFVFIVLRGLYCADILTLTMVNFSLHLAKMVQILTATQVFMYNFHLLFARNEILGRKDAAPQKEAGETKSWRRSTEVMEVLYGGIVLWNTEGRAIRLLRGVCSGSGYWSLTETRMHTDRRTDADTCTLASFVCRNRNGIPTVASSVRFSPWNSQPRPHTHTHSRWAASESEPLGDPSSPQVRFLPLLLVLHELLLHLFHGTLCWCAGLCREDIREGKRLAFSLKYKVNNRTKNLLKKTENDLMQKKMYDIRCRYSDPWL